MAEPSPTNDNAEVAQATEDAQASDFQGAQVPDDAESRTLAPEENDDEIDDLFVEIDQPAVQDDVVLHPVDGEVQEQNFAIQPQEHEINMEDVQPSQNEQDARGMTEVPEDEDVAPATHIPTYQNVDHDSLFVPDERVASPSPGLFGRPSLTRGPLNRPAFTSGPLNRPYPTPSLFDGLPTASPFTAQRSPSRVASTSVPASRPGAKSSASLYSKIRGLHKRISRPPQLVQPGPSRATYLDELLSHAPGRQPSAGLSTTAEDEHDKADREARAKYEKHKKQYEEIRKKNGKLNFAQDIAWMRIHTAEQNRLRKRKRDQDMARRQNDEESDLLPDTTGSLDDLVDDGPDDDVVDDDPAGSSRIPEPPSRRIFPSMVEAELQSMQVALQASADRPSKKRKGARTPDDDEETGRSRGRPKGPKSKASSAASGARAKAGVRKTAKDKKAAENAARLHTSLMYSDVFRQQASEDAPEQPTFTSRNKQDALKELIASVPTEHQKSVKDDTAALLRATKDFDGHGSCKADGNGMWKVRGMATSLKHYQVMGTAFMRRRENDLHEPRGGLMADQMGLGKTLMMLANIVNGQGNNDAGCKTTLLVASPALLTQWSREIDLHTNCGLIVMRFSSGSRIVSNHSFEIFRQHHIILTTYHEVLRSYPKNDPPIECQTAEQKIAWWKSTYEEHRGPLHRMMFHRIVLDEAQAIKNHHSRTSLACRALMARHKWALSGTPILNSLDELYSYFKFLGVPYTGSFKLFKHNYADPKEPESIERLLIRLSQFMIRRDHSDIMMNAPILKLPRASQMTHWCEFNSVERSIYEVVRHRFVSRLNASSRAGEAEKSYNNALVMLLRLRQLTAHILMLQLVVEHLLEREDIEKIREVVQREATDQRSLKGRTILVLRKQLDSLEMEAKKQSANKATNRQKYPHRPSAYHDDADSEERDIEELLDDSQEIVDVDRPLTRTSGRAFGKNFDFRPYLDTLTKGDNWEKVKKRAVCTDCNGPPHGAWLTSCGHILCDNCYELGSVLAAEEGRANATCKGCGSVFVHASQIQGDGDELVNAGPMTRAKRQKHSKVIERIEQEDIKEDWLTMGSEGVLPSAKTIALKAQLLNWFTENPNVKVIIYTQFLAMIRIIKKMCGEEKWGTEEYHGKMSQEARDKAIKTFADNGRVRVLLASLRCGGLGLNLTMASRVVILDPWWNSASEQQAFCRVFRFGQTETTCLTRFCVKNSVDERLIEMQERKEKEIDSVMKEDAGAKASKMGIRDLMRLFGNIRDDEEGRPFIMTDNVDPRGGFHADKDHEGYADEL